MYLFQDKLFEFVETKRSYIFIFLLLIFDEYIGVKQFVMKMFKFDRARFREFLGAIKIYKFIPIAKAITLEYKILI